MPEETSSNAKPQVACTAEKQSALTAAAAVLTERGFNAANGGRIMEIMAADIGCPIDGPWTKAVAPSDTSNQAGAEFIDIQYNILNGALYDYSDPVAFAREVPECYRQGFPHQECRPNYHPMFGDPKLTDTSATVCYPNPEWAAHPELHSDPQFQIMTPEEVCETPPAPRACKLSSDWKKFCRHKEASYDGCWGFPKADIVTGPPPRNVKSRIDLARAKKVQDSKALVAAAKPQELPGTLCEPLHWWGPYIK